MTPKPGPERVWLVVDDLSGSHGAVGTREDAQLSADWMNKKWAATDAKQKHSFTVTEYVRADLAGEDKR